MIDFHEILDRMNQNQRINFDNVFQRMARRWQQEGVKPRVLLHSCCGPCSTAVLDRLTGVADVTVYYFNPNIHPEAEYRRRELVQKQFIEAYNKETGHDVHFLAAPYEPETYFEAVKGLEDEPEGGARCRVCFVQRMKATAEKMQELGYDYFTTTLTVSPHKNSQVINEVGRDIEDQYATPTCRRTSRKQRLPHIDENDRSLPLYRQPTAAASSGPATGPGPGKNPPRCGSLSGRQ